MTLARTGRRAHKDTKCLKPKECFSIASGTLTKFVPIKMQGDFEAKNIHNLAIAMASQRQSVHSLHPLVSKGMSETNFWHHISKLSLESLEILNQKLLTNPIMECLPRDKPYTLAIDETKDPYYGKIDSENKEYVSGGPTKKSTKTSYRYITLELLLP